MLKIGIAQTINSISIESNYASISSFLHRFEQADVQLVMFPECCLSGFSAKISECSLDRLQSYLNQVDAWSKRTGIHAVLPTAIVEGGLTFNSGFCFCLAGVARFPKIGLTESEKKFFSASDSHSRKIFEVAGYKCALLICREAQQDPWTYFKEGEADFILWPGYWGWTKEDTWGPISCEEQPNLVHKNMSNWRMPLIQANFACNDLSDHRSSGPEGLSVVVDEFNELRHRGAHKGESGFIVTLDCIDGKMTVRYCQPL